MIEIERNSTVPFHQQVYDGYRAAIFRGDLRPGQRVPSSRDLAGAIRMSRFPILQAYAQLLAEGYFESRMGAGTFIARSLPEQLTLVNRHVEGPMRTLSGPRTVSRASSLYPPCNIEALPRGGGAFAVHQPALDQFPFQTWSNLVARHSRNPHASALHHISPLGSERFRSEICAYLRTARAVQCDPGQIMIVSGSQQALDITARVLLDPGHSVFVEEPGHRLQRTILHAAGCRLVPVPVDREGMNIGLAIGRRQQATAAVVTPSHQYPLGWTMSATRRLQLLDWAQFAGSWIVEDDWGSEYRYESSPIAALQGMDANSRVIYIGTFSNALFPSLRVGYVVIPHDLVERFRAVRFAMDIFPPYLYQEVLADFMREGHFCRHIRKMRNLYGERRKVLVASLRSQFGDMLQVHGSEAGMHVTVTLPAGYRDTEIAAKALDSRMWLQPLSPCYWKGPVHHGFVLGFGSTPVDQIPAAVAAMHALLG
ncbi:MAG TPA: PLP-dependent aminotransferase family protein [Acidobacteriaceae bacterium]|nr:PLP-dependent aminotransferase family protein [Acidobacteriaceae bacterium]